MLATHFLAHALSPTTLDSIRALDICARSGGTIGADYTGKLCKPLAIKGAQKQEMYHLALTAADPNRGLLIVCAPNQLPPAPTAH
jgi:hypothetical protein